MKKLAICVLAASSLIPVAALAAPPNGSFVFKDNTTYDQRCLVGRFSSQISQNGQFVGGNNDVGIDQTTYPGSRADAVQALIESCRANGANANDADDSGDDEL
jgi:hypothetical protein